MWIKFEKPRYRYNNQSIEQWINTENFDRIKYIEHKHFIRFYMYHDSYDVPATEYNMKQLEKVLNGAKKC